MKEAIKYFLDSSQATSLCEWSDWYSRMVWHRIHYARTVPRMRVFETTITQNLIFDLRARQFSNISIFESVNESANGDDIEIVKRFGQTFRKYAIQCKIAYKNEVFEAIDHRVRLLGGGPGDLQLDLLIDYSRRNGCVPIYFMYNYNRIHTSIGEEFGVSVVGAKYLKNKYTHSGRFVKKPTVQNMINGDSIPLRDFLCDNASLASIGDPIAVSKEIEFRGHFPFTKEADEDYHEFTHAEILQEGDWKRIETIEGKDFGLTKQGKEYQDFLPKYRFLINQ